MNLPDGHGMDVLDRIGERSETTPVSIVSAEGDIDTTVSALDAGAGDYLHKPYQTDDVLN